MKKIQLLPVLVVFGIVFVTGCGWLRPGGPPEEAHIEVSSEDVTQLTLIVSQVFVQIEDPECAGDLGCPVSVSLSAADTLVVSSPYSNTVEFTPRYQIYVEAYPMDEVEARVALKVDIDDKEWFNEERLLLPVNSEGQRDILSFVYQYGGVLDL